ncbi:hypothetical protein [Burkholderia phage FLC9]|nr:hypothetical protein [Burkholderia phage FLC9]
MVNLQGGQLPADPYNAERQPLQGISLNNPPTVPQFNAPGFMGDLIPVISAAIAMDIQDNAPRHPPRMFVYNLVSRNGFQNEIFAGLVMGVTDWVCLALADRKFQNPEQAAQALVPKMVEMFVAVQILQYPQLQSDTPVQAQQTVENLGRIWQELQNEIPQFKASNVYAQMMQGGFGGGNQGGGWAQQGNRWGGNQGGGWNAGGQQQSGRWGMGNQGGAWGGGGNRQAPRQFTGMNTGNTGLFSAGGGAGSSEGSSSDRFNTDRFATRGDAPSAIKPDPNSSWVPKNAPSEKVDKMTVPATPLQQVETKPVQNEPEHVDSTKLKWRPSLSQPYSLAYNPRTQLMYLQQQPDGAVIQLVKERTESPMDREKHRLPTTFGSIPKNVDTTKSAESLKRVKAGVKELTTQVGDGEAGEEPPKRPLVQVIEDAWVLETSETLAWLQGTLKCMATVKDSQVPDVFRIRAQVAEPFVAATDERGALQSFAEAKSYSELREMMLSVEGAMSVPLYKAINQRMTDVVNRVLSQNLSIPDIRITSFVEDAEEVAGAIEKFYGDAFSNAFLGNQVKNIRAAFAEFVTEEEEVLLTDNLLMDREYAKDKGPKITYLVANFTLTYLNVAAVELELELDPADKIASMITSDLPELYELARSIFEATEGELFHRHLIRTADDHLLEVTQGLIGQDVFLIRKVK